VLRDNPVYHLLVRNDLRSRFLANFLIADFSPIWIGSGEAAIDLILIQKRRCVKAADPASTTSSQQ
jgi:hypothetical protein